MSAVSADGWGALLLLLLVFLSNNSTDLYPSLSFGSLYFMPRNSNIDCSVGKSISTLSPFLPEVIFERSCSLSVYPKSCALCLMTVLNALEPVKYKVANAYSFGFVYRKSILRGIEPIDDVSCPMVRLFVLPLVNTSVTILSVISLSKKESNAFMLFSLLVTITSISPELSASLR